MHLLDRRKECKIMQHRHIVTATRRTGLRNGKECNTMQHRHIATFNKSAISCRQTRVHLLDMRTSERECKIKHPTEDPWTAALPMRGKQSNLISLSFSLGTQLLIQKNSLFLVLKPHVLVGLTLRMNNRHVG